jgi:3-oxoacyl-[acyl-carrier protein] reductase
LEKTKIVKSAHEMNLFCIRVFGVNIILLFRYTLKGVSVSIALVTGGTSGIGVAIVKRLISDGFRVVVHYHSSESRALELQKELAHFGQEILLFKLDLSQPEKIEQSCETFFKEHNLSPSVLVNNAGFPMDQLSVLMNWEEFDKVMKVNLYAPFFMSQWFIKQIPRKQSASIVNIGSLAGQIGNAGQANYSAAKAGLHGLTKSLAKEVGKKNIRINTIAAGVVETNMTQDIEFLEGIKSHIPLGRFGRPEEIAAVVSFLCSQDASYIHGQTISVNGGLYCP